MSLQAETFESFTYRLSDRLSDDVVVELTGYSQDAAGALVIPDEIDGKRVGSIAYGAFAGCAGLTEITIPKSVTRIGNYALHDCPELMAIHVVEGNKHYSSLDGVLFDAAQTHLIRYPEGRKGALYAVPQGVQSISSE